MIVVTFALIITFSSGMGMVEYYETKSQCLESLTKHVSMNPSRIDAIECAQLKEPAEKSDDSSGQ